MPIYLFECPGCGAAIEEIRSLPHRDDPLKCECGAKMIRIKACPTHPGKPGHYASLIMPDGSKVRSKNAKRRDGWR